MDRNFDHFKGQYVPIVDMSNRPIHRFDVVAMSYGRETLGITSVSRGGWTPGECTYHASSLDLQVVGSVNNIGTSLNNWDLITGSSRKNNNYLKSKYRVIPLECLTPVERRKYKEIVKTYVDSSSRKPISFGW